MATKSGGRATIPQKLEFTLSQRETHRYPNSYSIHLHHICCTRRSGESGRQPVARIGLWTARGPHHLARGSGRGRRRPRRRVRGDEASSREPELPGRWPLPADLRSSASPAARAGDTAAAAAEKQKSLCRNASHAPEVRTKIWVRMSQRERVVKVLFLESRPAGASVPASREPAGGGLAAGPGPRLSGPAADWPEPARGSVSEASWASSIWILVFFRISADESVRCCCRPS